MRPHRATPRACARVSVSARVSARAPPCACARALVRVRPRCARVSACVRAFRSARARGRPAPLRAGGAAGARPTAALGGGSAARGHRPRRAGNRTRGAAAVRPRGFVPPPPPLRRAWLFPSNFTETWQALQGEIAHIPSKLSSYNACLPFKRLFDKSCLLSRSPGLNILKLKKNKKKIKEIVSKQVTCSRF